jgi:hypothetical protein
VRSVVKFCTGSLSETRRDTYTVCRTEGGVCDNRQRVGRGLMSRAAVIAVLVGAVFIGLVTPIGSASASTPAKASLCSKAAKRANLGRCPAKPALRWSAPQKLESNQYGLFSVSCPSADFCAALSWTSHGETGHAYSWNGTSWSPVAPDVFGPLDLNHVSCPTAAFCAAGSPSGNAALWDGASWSASPRIRWPDPDDGITGVSCASISFCVAEDEDGDVRVWQESSWSLDHSTEAGGPAPAVSCASPTFCVVVTLTGNAITWDGAAFSAPQSILPGQQLRQVACPTTTFCMAVGAGDQWLTWDGTAWSAPSPIGALRPDPNPIFLNALSCPTATFCVLAGSNGTVSEWHGKSWTPLVQIDASLTSDRGQAAVTTTEHANLGLDAVSCASPSFCVAVGSDGNVIVGRAPQ